MIPFTGNPLDRAGERRTDAAWLTAQRSAENARVLPMWRLQPLLTGAEGAPDPRLCLVDGAVADGLGASATEVFLGFDGDAPVFARDISTLEEPQAGSFAGIGHFRDARSAAQIVGGTDAAIIGQARSLLNWHARHQFCAVCGARTNLMDGGYRRVCPACEAEHFPRTDPAVIMLVVRGNECMLGRNRRFPDGWFSALAGFVEPGETIEEAVRRETYEEAAVRIGAVRYVASQHWPFPSSLMIGCIAEAESRETKPDGVEILETRWFDKTTVRSILLDGVELEGVHLPSRIAIAHHLLRAWLKDWDSAPVPSAAWFWYARAMTKLLDQAIEAAKQLSPEAQDEVAHAILYMIESDDEPEEIDPEHLPGVLEGLAQIERGELATEEEVEAALARFKPKE